MPALSLWEAYGLKGNPFTTSPLVEGGALPIEQAFIGRKEELRILADVMREERASVFVSGNVGVGKTSLLNFHKHRFRTTDENPLLSPRRELEATKELMSKREFLLEIISAVYGEVKLLDPKKAAEDPLMRKIAAMVDFASLVELTTSTGLSVGFASFDASESRGISHPMQLTISQLERYLRELIDWVRSEKVAGKKHSGIIIHINNFDIVIPNDPQSVRRFFDELRDMLQVSHLYIFFLGPPNFYEEMVMGNARLRAVCSPHPLFLKPLSKSELNDAINQRYKFLSSGNDVNVIAPLSHHAISRLYDIFEGDIRSVLSACKDLVEGTGGRMSKTVEPDEALAILGKLKWREAANRGIDTPELQTVLSYIAGKPEGVTQRDVSQALQKGKSNISGYYFAQLKKKGLIEEGGESEQDKRLKYWKLTRDFSPLYFLRASMGIIEKRLEKQIVLVKQQMALF